MKSRSHSRISNRKTPPRSGGAEPKIGQNVRVVCGVHASLEAIRIRPQFVRELWVDPGFQSKPVFLNILKSNSELRSKLKTKTGSELNRWSHSHQGIVVFLEETPKLHLEELKRSKVATIVALDGLEDPQNLGALS